MDDSYFLEWLQTPLGQLLVAGATSALIILAAAIGKPLLVRRLKDWSQHTHTSIDDALVQVVNATRMGVVVIFALCVGAQSLEMPERAGMFIDGAMIIAGFVQLGLWVTTLLDFWVQRSRDRAMQTNAGAATSLAAISFVGHVLIWAVVLLLALDNLGINITALVAGLGIGGVAVALAVQNILGDLFASLSIVVDKPFVIGDFIIVDDYMGTVENVGLKTTRIRSLSGEQIIFSNSDLLKTRVRNYKRMYERRVVFNFDVTYETPVEKLETIPGIVKSVIQKQDKVRFDRAHFQKFGAYSLVFEVVYWILDPDYNLYMDIQQAINFGLMRELQVLDVSFAYPVNELRIPQPVQLEGLRSHGEDRERPSREGRPAYDA